MKTTELSDAAVEETVEALVAEHGEEQRARIESGVGQAAGRWLPVDGDAEGFRRLCLEQYAADPKRRAVLLARFEEQLEQILGHLHEVRRHLREPLDLDLGPVAPVDRLLARLDLSAHVVEDLLRTGVGFAVLLNFELRTLEEKLREGGGWSREQWARARAADLFASRVPPEIEQRITAAFTAADEYISGYDIQMHHLLTPEGERLFPAGMKLISHWGLRDELKTHYGTERGLERQRMIQAVMERIVAQQIPEVAVGNPGVDWVVESNEVRPADGSESRPDASREPDTRYRHLLEVFHAVRAADPHHPSLPTYIDRKFRRDREIPAEEVRRLLLAVLSAPVVADAAEIVARRIGRPLEPFDIWYDGFTADSGLSQSELDAAVGDRYPDIEAFRSGIPKILARLGFDAETAAFLGEKIAVDPARGAGHAMGAARREDRAHLRTRFGEDGMDFKGYNIAVHELGHNVEQILSLNRIDHYLLEGVPNTAFSEGFAFAFQAEDLALLGLEGEDPLADELEVLDILWTTWEIAGVGLVDMEIWEWMYEHPRAGPAELREATLEIARRVWNDYYAPVIGERDQTLLAIYSHIIDAGMYVPDYPLGFLIQLQMRAHFADKGLAGEMERMCKLGSISPDAWMRAAVGVPISAEPLLAAARRAVEAVSKTD